MKSAVMNWLMVFMVLILSVSLLGCQKNTAIKLGFIGDLSSKNADLAVAGRNGVILAVEQRNTNGGVLGKKVELLINDASDYETAKIQVNDLIGKGVEAIIGPMTSSMATAIVPEINKSSSILLSPTVNGDEFYGWDDNFFLMLSKVSISARQSAKYQAEKMHHRNIAVIYDVANLSYTYSWMKSFWDEFGLYGGHLVSIQGYHSPMEKSFYNIVRESLKYKPEAVLIIGNSLDTAIICQNIRKQNKNQKILIAEWSATERFIELAGKSAEGVLTNRLINQDDASEKFINFEHAYRKRFGIDPGYAGLAAYDAAQIILDAYDRRVKYEPLKKIIINTKKFSGVQEDIHINNTGDAMRSSYLATIKNGHYMVIE